MSHDKKSFPPTLCVGDLHGKYHIVDWALEYADRNSLDVLFIGDYVDDFTAPINDQLRTLDTVLVANEVTENVVALRGNHEESYLHPHMRCSGWNPEMQAEIDKRDLEGLDYYYWLGPYLISHAGISQDFLDRMQTTVKEYLADRAFHDIGRARGGRSAVGGLLWCDWYNEFTPVPGTPQVVGHSGYRFPGEEQGILVKDNSYCIDCYNHLKQFLILRPDSPPEIIQPDEK